MFTDRMHLDARGNRAQAEVVRGVRQAVEHEVGGVRSGVQIRTVAVGL
jgi:hypothetical protein